MDVELQVDVHAICICMFENEKSLLEQHLTTE